MDTIAITVNTTGTVAPLPSIVIRFVSDSIHIRFASAFDRGHVMHMSIIDIGSRPTLECSRGRRWREEERKNIISPTRSVGRSVGREIQWPAVESIGSMSLRAATVANKAARLGITFL